MADAGVTAVPYPADGSLFPVFITLTCITLSAVEEALVIINPISSDTGVTKTRSDVFTPVAPVQFVLSVELAARETAGL